MNAVIFPGQGAQYTGMGKDLFDNFKEARDLFSRIDKAVGFELSKKCFQGSFDELKDTSIQQIAILAVNLVAYEAFKTKNISIDYFSGLSLGEYACLNPTGVLSLENVFILVKERALAMQEAAALSPSSMYAVIGLDASLIKQKEDLGYYLANINSPSQIVVSFAKEARDKVKDNLLSLGAKRVIELEVSGGFHSPFMEKAKTRLAKVMDSMEFSNASAPIVSNFTACAHTDKDQIKSNLINQLTSTVLWNNCVGFLKSAGVNTFFESGPSKVLKGILRKIDSELCVVNIEKSQDINNLAA